MIDKLLAPVLEVAGKAVVKGVTALGKAVVEHFAKHGTKYLIGGGTAAVGGAALEELCKNAKDANGGEFEARVTYFEMNYGLSVENEKALIRICNIDPSNVNGDALAKKIPNKNAIFYLSAEKEENYFSCKVPSKR